MNQAEVITLLQQELPQLIAQDPQVRDFVLRTVSEYYAGKVETESKFDRILAELQRDREEQSRRWDEQAQQWAEQSRRWDEQAQKWTEQDRKWDEQLAEIRRLDRKFESTIGALGSRWGLYSEASFRNGLKAILEESFQVEVLNLNDFDETGEVFGQPDQVEIDVIIKNGVVILCELKSSIDKAGMYSFDRKASFYARTRNRPVARKIVICPMVDSRAIPVAERLGIEIYSYSDRVEGL
ncbi:MAG: PD-(D/E)XK nuclease family protein [Prochlorothrix sp.]